MIAAIHQPEHFSWLGFFDKARQVDTFVILDNVQFRKNYFQNRNRIRVHSGSVWITVPVLTKNSSSQLIQSVSINNDGDRNWRRRALKTLKQTYSRAPFWVDHCPFIEHLYECEWDKLIDLNEAIIRYLFEMLGIQAKVLRASELAVDGQKSDLILNICKRVGADIYLSGISGKEYLDLASFEQCGIAVRFQEFRHPVYPQLFEPFLPCMSIVDLLFNCGPRSSDILAGIGVPTLDTVFE